MRAEWVNMSQKFYSNIFSWNSDFRKETMRTII